MEVVNDNQLGSLTFTTPKLVIVEVTPSPYAEAASTNVIGVVGQTTRGDGGKIYTVGSMPQFERKLGSYNTSCDGYLFCKNIFDANGSLIKFVVAESEGRLAATKVFNNTVEASPDVVTPIMSITVDSKGIWGNFVEAVFLPSPYASQGYFNLTVRNTKTNEVCNYIKTTTDIEDERYIGKLVSVDGNKFFTVAVTSTTGIIPDMGTFSLAGGTNGLVGSNVLDSSYIGIDSSTGKTGIQTFKSPKAEDVSIVVSARNSDSINTALLVHVQDIKLSPRRTIIAYPVGTTLDELVTKLQAYDTEKAKVIFPNVKVENPFTYVEEIVSPVSFEAANDTLIGYWQSASQTKLPDTVKDTEYDLDPTDIDTCTQNRINPIVLKIGKGFIRASDYTLSVNPALSENVVRKGKDFFAKSYFDITQPFLSKPITPLLWREMRKSMDSFCSLEAQAGHIGKTDGTKPYKNVIDRSNNPIEIVQQKKVIVYSQISLLAPANTILVFLDAQLDKQIAN